MASDNTRRGGRAARLPAIAGYALFCIAIGAAVTGLMVFALGAGDRDAGTALPPLRETQLVKAVQAGGCELRRTGGAELARPADGRAAAPADPRVYEDAPPREQLTAALRRGVIVISYRDGLNPDRLEQLRALQSVVPGGTIVAPGASGMRYAVAAAAYRRLLGCQRFDDAVIDAIRLFRGRYVGTGPDR